LWNCVAELRFWRENLLNDSERIGTVWLVEGQASCYWASKARKGLSDAHAHAAVSDAHAHTQQ
jgi:hypothetical protein